MGRWRPRALVATGLIALTTACGTSPSGGRGAAPAAPVIEEATADGKPRIELLAPGATPRAPLRLTPSAGVRTDADVSTVIRGRLDSGDETRMEMAYGWTGTVVDAGTDIHVAGQLDHMSFDGEPAEPLAVAFSYVLSSSGWITRFELDKPEPAPMEVAIVESARQALALLAVFPAAPIGVGARWRHEVEVVQNGTPVAMTFTSALIERDGPRARIRAELAFRSIPEGPISIEGSGALEQLVDVRQAVQTTRLTMKYVGHVAIDTPETLRGDATMTVTPRR